MSAADRRRAAFAVQAAASSLRVCWALMAPTLHRIKRNNSNNNSSRNNNNNNNSSSSRNDRNNNSAATNASTSTKINPLSTGGRGHNTTHRNNSCKKEGRVGGSGWEEWDDDDDDDVDVDVGITKVTAGSLLAGICEKAFQPAISLSFRPPAPN